MKLRPVAVIDIGSNTIRSLIVEILPDGNYRVLDDEREVARLASGLSRRRRLSRDAIQRALGSLKRMAEIIRARGVRTLCVHGDNPQALDFVRRLRAALVQQGATLRPFTS